MIELLVAYEESQEICIAFREKGIKAYSCDLKPCSGGHPEWHIQGDVWKVIERGWDMLIAHPPCTHLAVSGSKHFEEKRASGVQQQAIEEFMRVVNLPIERMCIENPVGVMSTYYRPPDQIVNPYDFGDAAAKKTCLWLKNLPKLRATTMDAPLFGMSIDKGEFHVTKGGKKLPKWYNLPPSPERSALRSKTFRGMAQAMADQWSRG